MKAVIITGLVLATAIFGYGYYRKNAAPTIPPPPGAGAPGTTAGTTRGPGADVKNVVVQTQAPRLPKFGIMLTAVSQQGKKPVVTTIDPAGFDSMFSPVSNVPITYDKYVNGVLWQKIGPGGKVLWSKGPYPDNITSLGFTVEPGCVNAEKWPFAYYMSPDGKIPPDWFKQARQHGTG